MVESGERYSDVAASFKLTPSRRSPPWSAKPDMLFQSAGNRLPSLRVPLGGSCELFALKKPLARFGTRSARR